MKFAIVAAPFIAALACVTALEATQFKNPPPVRETADSVYSDCMRIYTDSQRTLREYDHALDLVYTFQLDGRHAAAVAAHEHAHALMRKFQLQRRSFDECGKQFDAVALGAR
jgi:hypothetical protein